MRRLHTTLVAAAAALLLAGGCGSGGGSSDDPKAAGASGDPTPKTSASTAPSATATPVKIARASFCGEIDAGAVSAAFDNPGMTLTEDLEPGEAYEVMGNQMISKNWLCRFGKKTDTLAAQVQFTLAIRSAPASRTDFQQAASIPTDQTGTKCASTPAEGFGPDGVVLSCSRKKQASNGTYQSGFASASYMSLVGDAMVFCYAESGSDRELPRLEKATAELCPTGIKAMAE